MNPFIPFVYDMPHNLQTIDGLMPTWKLDKAAKKRGDRNYKSRKGLPLACRWLKDDKTVLLYAEKSLEQMGIGIDLGNSGIIKTSKRLSRLFRPSRFFARYTDLRIKVDDRLDPALWDGMALIRRWVLVDLVTRSPWMQAMAEAEPERHADLVREMETIERVEITVLTNEGQIKGHALVIDDRPGYEEVLALMAKTWSDIIVAPGAFKPEVFATDDWQFVAIEPVHGKDDAGIDIQSITNLWPFVQPFVEPALVNLRRDNRWILDSLYRGVYRFPELPASELDDDTYPLMLVSRYGVDPLAYPSVMNMVARGRLSQLDRMRRHLHLPLPNLHRRYLTVDVNSGGEFLGGWGVDMTSLYVSAAEYAEVAGVLGGTDLDDGIMVLPFIDWDMSERTLIWRQPNQAGEYWLLDGWGGLALPEEPVFADSRDLFPRIDRQENRPPAVPADEPPFEWDAAVARLKGNEGAIGIFANYMMVAISATGEMPQLPCSFESIIDATVKDGRDVSRQVAQVEAAMDNLCRSIPIPAIMLPRAPEDLRFNEQVAVAENHWLDLIHDALVDVYDELDGERVTFKDVAHLPIRDLLANANLERGELAYRYFFGLAEQYRRPVVVNGEVTNEPDWPEIGKIFAQQLAAVTDCDAERDGILLGILAYAGVRGQSDLPCFMATTAAKAFCAMAAHGVTQGDVPSFAVEGKHVWFNRLQAQQKAAGQPLFQRMAEVSEEVRAFAKAGVARLVEGLSTVVVEGRNVLSEGKLLGLLPKYAEVPDGRYQVLAAGSDTHEGSLYARLSLLFTL